MRKVLQFALCALLFSACATTPSLKPEEALTLINQTYHYPAKYGYTLYLDDPELHRLVQLNGLDTSGLLNIVPEGEVIPEGAHQVSLTEKGRSYLMVDSSLPEGQQRVHAVTAYIAETDPEKAIAILDEPKAGSIVAQYQVSYRDHTPFTAMAPTREFTKPETKKVYFQYQGNAWKLIEKPEQDFGGNATHRK
ncbi:hypothetical protein MKQ68_18945 [Chitinophaga horti]|uniref:Uncharacterized protein n=1 Tax=Chitinophaga horti TaxID=2920382 RepID=A0ABY6IXQ3_9BACT|nr:hypothetical protein [Chitinophaga horti]UYQ92168.1 hypothetical protein MKQ68_18945 [Chitinophaga horti]